VFYSLPVYDSSSEGFGRRQSVVLLGSTSNMLSSMSGSFAGPTSTFVDKIDTRTNVVEGDARTPYTTRTHVTMRTHVSNVFGCFCTCQFPYLEIGFPTRVFTTLQRCALLGALPCRMPVITHGASCVHRTFWKHASKVSRRHHEYKRALGSTCSNTIPRESLGLNGHDRRRE
jgi:hypothetical protein